MATKRNVANKTTAEKPSKKKVAKKKVTKKKRAAKKKAPAALPFSKRLVLNQYLLSLFGYPSFDELAAKVKDAPEGLNEASQSHFYVRLVEAPPETATLTADQLLSYDERIAQHSARINVKRGTQPISWKYFQYLALLFTEVYLDRYFTSVESLCSDLNAFLDLFNTGKPKGDQLPPYQTSDLNKIAFWSATGSGKTLLMHVNILQYQQYLADHQREKELNRVIVLTPNSGLSEQHLKNFDASGISAQLFEKTQGDLFGRNSIDILHVQRLADKDGPTTVATEAFEGNNLVLVDEGHRGTSGEEWMQRREALCESGFSFEYSATFGQAVGSGGPSTGMYAKCILFDYSYRYFYQDGYGKDYRILNLEADDDDDTRQLYLTAALLSFYQQLRVHHDKGDVLRPFLLEKPLWIFVGSSVSKSTGTKDLSDIEDIVLFLGRFLADEKRAVRNFKRLIDGKSRLLNKAGQELFSIEHFAHLAALKFTADALFSDILRLVFNAAHVAKLHMVPLAGVDGELALAVGDATPFGVINVSDPNKVAKKCDAHRDYIVVENKREFAGSLFKGLNDDNSPTNILIGAKKFTEGWSGI